MSEINKAEILQKIKTMTSAIADIKPTFEEVCPIGIINFET